MADALAVDLATPPLNSPNTVATESSITAASDLTPRQQEILGLMCERLTDHEIAARLFLSPRTVEGHVSQIIGKLGVANRRQAAAAARLALV